MLIAVFFVAFGQGSSLNREKFNSPEKRNYPETWFHFIGNHFTLDGVTADLEAIADAKISGIQFFHGGGSKSSWRDAEVGVTPLSKGWDNVVQSKTAYIAPSEILDISSSMSRDGRLVWSAPSDRSWTLEGIDRSLRNLGWRCLAYRHYGVL